jgi:hypothetical protein
MRVAAKAFLAAVVAGGGAFLSSLTNSHVTLVGGLSAAVAALTALSAVYAVPNKTTPPTP